MSNLRIHSPFDDVLRLMEQFASGVEEAGRNLYDQIAHFRESIEESARRWQEATRHFAEALAIVSVELPKRGWYLSGKEPATVIAELAQRIKTNDQDAVDDVLLEQAAELRVDNDRFQQVLAHHGAPVYCIERVRLVLEHRDAGSHEVATILGVTVIDELSRHLYDGRDFTTKGRSRGSTKPRMASCTVQSRRRPSQFADMFVQAFGSVQKQTDRSRLDDENYFCRHAILHGEMLRPYGPKDSAKVFMIIMFLVLGLEDIPSESSAEESH